jgi:hypothetical protein
MQAAVMQVFQRPRCGRRFGRRHRLNKSRIASMSENPDGLGKLLLEAAVTGREDPETAYRLLRPHGNVIRYLGPPFATKYLYFAGGGEPRAPVPDTRIPSGGQRARRRRPDLSDRRLLLAGRVLRRLQPAPAPLGL